MLNQAKSYLRIKNRIQLEYSKLGKEVKQISRRNNIELINKLAGEAENASGQRDLRSLYRMTIRH